MLMHNKLVSKYTKIKNTRIRNKRLARVGEEVDEALAPQLHEDSTVTSESIGDVKVRLVETGFHPDLVFFNPSLSETEREVGIEHICGFGLEKEEDIWLLENLWRAVRWFRPPPVPIVLSHSWKADEGYLEIPFDFTLPQLTDFLEDNLETVRNRRKELLDSFIPI
jgi:hypothetical protein